jgi:hypothetical protein
MTIFSIFIFKTFINLQTNFPWVYSRGHDHYVFIVQICNKKKHFSSLEYGKIFPLRKL